MRIGRDGFISFGDESDERDVQHDVPATATERVFVLRQLVDAVDESTTAYEERNAYRKLAATAAAFAKRVPR